MDPILIEISPGELIDRLTILRLKARHVREPTARARVERELAALEAAGERLPASAALAALVGELAGVNGVLWRCEDAVRSHVGDGEDGEPFAEVARAIFRNNDRRAALKRRINARLGSTAGELKVFANPLPLPAC